MTIRIDGEVAHVDTVAEAFEVADMPGLKDVIITDNMERLKLHRLLKGFGIKDTGGRMDG
ncbi:hypothetical protein SEA_WOLLYPOG_72 [Arthrobacter phage Wollypog]|uniref:Uncharacterized protein n=1 Tax=Arthrobacter phage Wollypog TaxID=2790985 RepID=A0A7T3KCA2_9CAUD|nr:hypothetical protein PP291_gp72 [Arthrobacter phage Wollypog]QPX62621.1 hypothetical protein SEA_WOLLYPOG_72 [Arthrobacter phage Wollypog]